MTELLSVLKPCSRMWFQYKHVTVWVILFDFRNLIKEMPRRSG